MFAITQTATPANRIAQATPIPELPIYDEDELDDLFDRLERGDEKEEEETSELRTKNSEPLNCG